MSSKHIIGSRQNSNNRAEKLLDNFTEATPIHESLDLSRLRSRLNQASHKGRDVPANMEHLMVLAGTLLPLLVEVLQEIKVLKKTTPK